MTTVANHLTAAREAHRQYRDVAGVIEANGDVRKHKDRAASKAAIKAARRHRQKAEALDPMRSDPAWADDATANRGVTHDELMDFYARVLHG